MGLLRQLRPMLVSVGIATLAALTVGILAVAYAPDGTTRYQGAVIGFGLATAGFITALSMCASFLVARYVSKTSTFAVQRAEESMQIMLEHLERLQANPATAATGQRAIDDLRNLWGDKIEDWLSKARLN
jgi:hypothetical protein